MTTYVLNVPPSTNELYCGPRRAYKTKKYSAWIRGELRHLLSQRARPAQMPVSVTIQVPESNRRDADNYGKPILDLLVRAGVLVDDRSDYVKALSISFAAIDMCHVKIETMEQKP